MTPERSGSSEPLLNVLDRRRLYERVLGGLATAAIGDALGAPTEACTRQEIAEHYGGLVRTLAAPGTDAPASGSHPGQITDDASQMLAFGRGPHRRRGRAAGHRLGSRPAPLAANLSAGPPGGTHHPRDA
ncbi:MAG: hypothetical protein GEU81_16810 [Nitriliruptorales bacterium]|nr:hypothetical protein [Nitriliruptorales bacterium]